MSSSSSSVSPADRKLGRAAGFCYLAIFATGILWYAVMQGMRAGGDAAILGHIRAGRLLYAFSILGGAGTFTAYLVIAALLYRRFRDEAGIAVTLLFAFVVGSVSFSLIAVELQMDLLSLAAAAGAPAQDLPGQVATIMRDWDNVGRLSSLFWGLWLLPLAWITWRSGGIGRAVGVFVALGGIGYMSAFVRPILAPGGSLGPLDIAFGAATVLSELIVTLWLIFLSDRPSRRA